MTRAKLRTNPLPTMIAAALLAAGCAGEVGGIPPTIFNGELDVGHPSVGALLAGDDRGAGFVCTATLVGQRTVLTAAHCVEAAATVQDVTYLVRLEGTSHEVEQVTIHPQYAGYGRGAAPYEVYAHDVAVLRLTAAPAVAPTPIATAPPQVGQAITLVGYGGRPPVEDPPVGENGKPEVGEPAALERHVATNRVHTPRPEYYVFELGAPADGNICSGDSGGPTFAMVGGIEAQIGVHSQSLCRQGGGADRRVDVHAAWIEQAAGGDVLTVDGAAGGAAPPSPGDGPGEVTPGEVTPGEGQQPPPGDGTTPQDKQSPAPGDQTPGDGETTPEDKQPQAPSDQTPGDGQTPPPPKEPLPDDGGAAPGDKPPLPGSGKPGTPCTQDSDCSSNKCVPATKGAVCA